MTKLRQRGREGASPAAAVLVPTVGSVFSNAGPTIFISVLYLYLCLSSSYIDISFLVDLNNVYN